MTSPLHLESTQLRSAAGALRDDVVSELNAAIGKIPCEDSGTVYGPTAGPAAGSFQTSWRSELAAVVSAVEQLATSLDEAATGYDSADWDSGQRLSGGAALRPGPAVDHAAN
jgi:hypothetical protein